MEKPVSAQGLFEARKPKKRPHPAQILMGDLPIQKKPKAKKERDTLDYDPTPTPDVIPFLAAEGEFIRAHGDLVWENAAGGGHMVRALKQAGFKVIASDLVDRGCPGVILRDFYGYRSTPAPVCITNPPYGEVSAGGGHGRWLRHIFSLGIPYIALLLNSEWSFARANGFDALFNDRPPSIEYACCWKIDFRQQGNPSQRNSWFVWDSLRPPIGPNRWETTRLYREQDFRQGEFI